MNMVALTGDDFPMWIVYVSQNLTFGGGLLGITYGIMSTSWDPSREGTVRRVALSENAYALKFMALNSQLNSIT